MKWNAASVGWKSIVLVIYAASIGAHAQEQEPGGAAHMLAQGASSFDAKLPAEVEVLRAQTGHLLVKPKINGKQPGWFIFDTGAGICVVSKPHLDGLELSESGSVQAVGVGGSENAKVYRAAEVTLGRVTLRDHPVMTTDLSFLKAHLGEEIVGVIGYGLFTQCVAEMDLATPRIALHDPASFELVGAAWMPMDLSTRVPSIEAKFEDKQGTFALDTGSNNPLSFTARAVREWNLLDGRETTDAQTGGVGGFVPTKRGVVDWVEFGGVRQSQVTSLFAIDDAPHSPGAQRTGTIGAPLLKPFVLFTDYAKSRIAFKPRSEASDAAASK